MMTNKKLIFGVLTILILLVVGFATWKILVNEPKTEAVIIVSGYVISGGDTTPKGLFDTPRRFIYTVQKDDGTSVDVQYTAYPPSPAGDRKRKKIRLDFHGGTIKIGDYLKARGTYEKESNILIVSNEGDYIETYSEKQ